MSAWIQKKSALFISIIEFTNNNSEKVIKKLIPNKRRRHDVINAHMLKLCSRSTSLQLMISFCFRNGMSLLNGKKKKVVSVHNKCDKKTLKDYWPISLLPICVNFYERLLHSEMQELFTESNLTPMTYICHLMNVTK